MYTVTARTKASKALMEIRLGYVGARPANNENSSVIHVS